MPNADLVRNPRILIKPNEILDSVPNAHLISSPQIPVMPNADLVSDPQHLGIPNVIPAYDPQYLEMSTNNPVVNHPQIIRVRFFVFLFFILLIYFDWVGGHCQQCLIWKYFLTHYLTMCCLVLSYIQFLYVSGQIYTCTSCF